MKLSNIFKAAPAWLSNVLSLIFALLVLVNTSGPELLKFFGDIDCQQCVSTFNSILGSVAFLLGVAKVFSSSSGGQISKPTINTLLVLILCNFAIHITSYSGYNREIRTGNDPPAVSIR